jgi:hypothetical protein
MKEVASTMLATLARMAPKVYGAAGSLRVPFHHALRMTHRSHLGARLLLPTHLRAWSKRTLDSNASGTVQARCRLYRFDRSRDTGNCTTGDFQVPARSPAIEVVVNIRLRCPRCMYHDHPFIAAMESLTLLQPRRSLGGLLAFQREKLDTKREANKATRFAQRSRKGARLGQCRIGRTCVGRGRNGPHSRSYAGHTWTPHR